ncbi:MAG: HNH endonuclease [Alphaproteobacteria bacterium]|nr:HNH endonuclease [Alphaproteobacteria bacterium]
MDHFLHEQRAYQAWPHLVECAKNKDTITYGELAHRLGMHHRPINLTLGKIQSYCMAENLDPLTILVTDQKGGLGEGFIAWDINNREEGLNKVYNYNWDKIPNPFEYTTSDNSIEDLAIDLIKPPYSSEKILSIVNTRGVLQQIFRSALLQAYEYQCAFCGLSYIEALEAAHIIPWANSTNEKRVSVENGILLCATHHKLFDAGWLTINAEHSIQFSEGKEKYKGGKPIDNTVGPNLHGKRINLPKDKRLIPSRENVAFRNKKFGWDL